MIRGENTVIRIVKDYD